MSRRIARILVERLKAVAGIRVDPQNEQFLTFRLNRRLDALGLASYEDYLSILEGPKGEAETARLVEMLVTHTTSFFREPAHFDWLAKTGLPSLCDKGAGRLHPLTIWSAACSTGPELWSAGIVVDQFAQAIPGGLRWGMIGTDISANVLRRAAGAVFSATEMAGIREEDKRQYFLRSRPGVATENGMPIFRVAPELRSRASFLQANLLQPLPDFPLADLVFLRNVLIYFALEDRQTCLGHVCARIRSGGYLLLGHSDSHHGLPPGLTQCGPSIFRKV
ncbi:CheR family methyltransferase [Stagnihabitans tardus]|uniref:protein-glutamate O-methyltransferase n=1 Tax=Stagnihabitans tardus TaxID=2699202 RepID=A0AAE4Y7S1_9RHOB|nr:CheR family methyltransferase [Stagnihabitans tardus]NBZ86724.1 SAM-dependent methyltransferase [Stagnihabitans tardus]